ncbi:MAG: RNase adapter RapZ, partial [Candidatus Rokuibacteriota bacterium]
MAGPITFVVITGMSGAGKSYAIKCFEDMGFFCVDNLPTTLIPTFADLVARSTHTVDRVALGVDVREGEYLTHLLDTLAELRKRGHTAEVLFLEASEESLVRRYRETRRRHPLAPDGNVLDGIRAERKMLSTLREVADRVVDSSA